MTYAELITTIKRHKGNIECHVANIGPVRVYRNDLIAMLTNDHPEQESGMGVRYNNSGWLTVDTEF